MVKTNNKIVLGVDIGGSKIRIIAFGNGKIYRSWGETGPSLTKLKEGIEFLGNGIKNIGIAAPGLIDYKAEKILKCSNLAEFDGLNFSKILKGYNVELDNDAKCFLRAEIKFGKVALAGCVLGVVFGTGIGGAFSNEKLKMKNEKINKEVIYRGKDGWAGEFGHMIIDGGQDWEKLYQKTRNKPREQEKINAIGLANLINLFNPEVIIFGGKGAKIPAINLIEKYLPLAKKQMPRIILSELKEDAVALGAAMLFD